jgi:hypothetical protein
MASITNGLHQEMACTKGIIPPTKGIITTNQRNHHHQPKESSPPNKGIIPTK